MNKKDIYETLQKYNFDKNKYIVISGAAMVIQGVKDSTTDIDIAVSKDYYNYLLKKYNCTFDCINKFKNRVYFIDNIINFSLSYYDSEYKIIDDIKIQSLKSIKKLKESLKRAKDKKDINLIEKKLNDRIN